MKVLGIESSCDDLSMAIIDQGNLIAQVTSSQVIEHAPYGGVVPEIASRRHLENIDPVLKNLLSQANITLNQIEGVAATFAPGLVGSLLVGLNFAKALAYALKIPFRGIHHIEGHLWSVCLEHQLKAPFLALAISGGHTHLYQVDSLGKYQTLGHTVDDAIGEAFDKVAKMMGLSYPGGPAIEKLAKAGDPKKYEFTLPQVKKGPLLTSFSGMKTAALEYYQTIHQKKEQGELEEYQRSCADLAASFQYAAVRAISRIVLRAIKEFNTMDTLIMAGGVACNQAIRQSLQKICDENKVRFFYPTPKYCTDNGAMIAYVGEQYLLQGKTSPLELNAQARLSLDTLDD